MANTTQLSENAIDLIMQFEVGGTKKYYDKFLKHPSWPGGASGVTIGIGYDLGYTSTSQFQVDWQDKLSANDYVRLRRVLGLKGGAGRSSISGVRDIEIPWEAALSVFEENTIPDYIAQTLQAFPNSENLPDDAFGALVSIVFNRGPLIDNSDRRKEMKEIRRILLRGNDEVVDAEDIRDIAAQVRSMARLWKDVKSSDGDLHDRRLAEAELIENSLN